MTDTYVDEVLAHDLALNVCDQWKHQNGSRMLSAEDLDAVKEWMQTPRCAISIFPDLRALAARGLDSLLVNHSRAPINVANRATPY